MALCLPASPTKRAGPRGAAKNATTIQRRFKRGERPVFALGQSSVPARLDLDNPPELS